jgi:hypothetical protein
MTRLFFLLMIAAGIVAPIDEVVGPSLRVVWSGESGNDTPKQKAVKVAPTLSLPTRDPAPIVTLIDVKWSRALRTAKLTASPMADDAEFLRRVCLDLTGRIPSHERTISFLNNDDPAKREQLIDDLLMSRDFGQQFAQRWRNLIAPRDLGSTKQSSDRFTPWLADQFNANRPWGEIVTTLLTSEANLSRDPEAAFFQANSEENNPKASLLAASVGRLFLGVQIGCAECHNHPFAEWKQEDFWGLAAFFSRVRKQSKQDFSLTEQLPDGAESSASLKIPDGAGKGAGRVVPARFLNADEPVSTTSAPLRPSLAEWVTSRENSYFAQAMVNRVWSQLFGRGFVNPVDDFRAANLASHPELLQQLAKEFAESGHDIKHLVRCICRSQAYQLTSRPLDENSADEKFFSHQAVKVMTPEVLYDSLYVVFNANPTTAPPTGGKKVKSEKRSEVVLESRETFVRHFLRAAGADQGNQFAYGIPQQLRFMNAADSNQVPPFIAEMLAKGTDSAQMIDTLYLVVLSRRASPMELQRMSDLLGEHPESAEAHHGVFWVLLNSTEFILNH